VFVMPFMEVTVIWQLGPVAVLPPLFVGGVMVGKSRGGENDGCEGEDDGLGFHGGSPSVVTGLSSAETPGGYT